MAKSIWQVGLPDIPDKDVLRATEQHQPLQQHVKELIATATMTIVKWLSTLATSIQVHKATPAYQIHARKSGTQKGRSGLTEEELSAKELKKQTAKIKFASKPYR